MPQRTWTQTEDDYLIAQRALDRPVPEIASELRRGVPTTYQRCAKLGLIRQPHSPWTEDLKASLIALATGTVPLSMSQIGAQIGKPTESVRWKLGDLGIVTTYARAAKARAEKAREEKARAPVSAQRTRMPKEIDAERATERALAKAKTEIAKAAARREAQAKAAAAAAQRRAEREKDREAKAAQKRLAQEEARTAKRQATEAAREAKRSTQKAAPVAPRARPASSRISTKAAGGRDRQAEERIRRAREAEIAWLTATPRPALPPIPEIGLCAPATSLVAHADSAPAISGRGGWKTIRRGPKPAPCRAPTRDETVRLSQAAAQAVARFEQERGFTRPALDPVEAVITYLRRRGYVVVTETDDQGTTKRWTVDHRHRLVSPGALRQFAEARGYA